MANITKKTLREFLTSKKKKRIGEVTTGFQQEVAGLIELDLKKNHVQAFEELQMAFSHYTHAMENVKKLLKKGYFKLESYEFKSILNRYGMTGVNIDNKRDNETDFIKFVSENYSVTAESNPELSEIIINLSKVNCELVDDIKEQYAVLFHIVNENSARKAFDKFIEMGIDMSSLVQNVDESKFDKSLI